MATVLVGAMGRRTLATLWLASALVCGCRSPSDGPAAATTGSTPVVNLQSTPLQVPIVDAGHEQDGATALGDAGSLVPIEGFVYDRHPDYDDILGRKVSEDGSLVAIGENLVAGKKESPDRYVIVKSVDDDKEVFRLNLHPPGGYCGNERHALPICAERQARADAFLSKHKWMNLRLFWMDPGVAYPACDMKIQRQRLAFKSLEVTFGDLRVRVAKPTGDILIDRKLPGWRVFADQDIPPARAFYAFFVGLSLERRVLLLALRPCGHVEYGDPDPRFHVIRLPETL